MIRYLVRRSFASVKKEMKRPLSEVSSLDEKIKKKAKAGTRNKAKRGAEDKARTKTIFTMANLIAGEKYIPKHVINIPVDFTNFLIPPDYNEKFIYNLPYNIKGSDRRTKFGPKNFIQRIINNQKPKDMDFKTIFYKFYDKFIDALVNNDTSFISEHCEKRLATKSIQALTDLKKDELKVNFIFIIAIHRKTK